MCILFKNGIFSCFKTVFCQNMLRWLTIFASGAAEWFAYGPGEYRLKRYNQDCVCLAVSQVITAASIPKLDVSGRPLRRAGQTKTSARHTEASENAGVRSRSTARMQVRLTLRTPGTRRKRARCANQFDYLFKELWRRGWDSNPRYGLPHAGFQDRCLKPLGHPSRIVVQFLPSGFWQTRGLMRLQPSCDQLSPGRFYSFLRTAVNDYRIRHRIFPGGRRNKRAALARVFEMVPPAAPGSSRRGGRRT